MHPVQTRTKQIPPEKIFVAPMMAWTDRHCRYLHRLFTPSATLFTEMVTTGALLHGNRWDQLTHDPAEYPLVLQLGGSNPHDLGVCARRAGERGFSETNLNVGCPSDRVAEGASGACLMRKPDLVADCVKEMSQSASQPISVKCRLGVDDADTDELLHRFVATVAQAGCQRFFLHARKAILGKLTPAQNRDIPPLQPERVRKLKSAFPELDIIINGGIDSTSRVKDYLQWAGGVMLGRAAYHNPQILRDCHNLLAEVPLPAAPWDIVSQYRAYAEIQVQAGERLSNLTRHMLGMWHGRPGARAFRRVLSDAKRLRQNDLSIFEDALACVTRHAACCSK